MRIGRDRDMLAASGDRESARGLLVAVAQREGAQVDDVAAGVRFSSGSRGAQADLKGRLLQVASTLPEPTGKPSRRRP